MAFKLVKTGKSYSERRDTLPTEQSGTRGGSPPEGYRLKYPDAQATSEELEEIAARVRGEGYVLLWSTVLQDLIAFYGDEEARSKIPPGFVPYSEAELEELFGDGRLPLPTSTLRLIHEAKKHGGRVTRREGDGTR
jgi:hypothetical protein